MSEHETECPVAGFVLPPAPEPLIWPRCICDRLRACEARVRIGWEMSNGPAFDFARGYAAALSAARDAVAAASLRIPYEETRIVYLTDALAAIDALRGDA